VFDRTNWGKRVADKPKEPLPGSPELYRQRAEEMRALARQATSEEGRQTYLKLAAHWDRLAVTLEHPNW
jgi:hypothetical protein